MKYIFSVFQILRLDFLLALTVGLEFPGTESVASSPADQQSAARVETDQQSAVKLNVEKK